MYSLILSTGYLFSSLPKCPTTENCLLSLRIASDYLSGYGRDNYGNPKRRAPRQPQCNKQNFILAQGYKQIMIKYNVDV